MPVLLTGMLLTGWLGTVVGPQEHLPWFPAAFAVLLCWRSPRRGPWLAAFAEAMLHAMDLRDAAMVEPGRVLAQSIMAGLGVGLGASLAARVLHRLGGDLARPRDHVRFLVGVVLAPAMIAGVFAAFGSAVLVGHDPAVAANMGTAWALRSALAVGVLVPWFMRLGVSTSWSVAGWRSALPAVPVLLLGDIGVPVGLALVVWTSLRATTRALQHGITAGVIAVCGSALLGWEPLTGGGDQQMIFLLGWIASSFALREGFLEVERHAEVLESTVRRRTHELEAAMVELSTKASTDPLTGVWNRRRLEEAAENLMLLLGRFPEAASLVLLDIDHFKNVNDRHGHATGDTVLREFAYRTRRVCREHDHLARWGGEEFLILCTRTSLQGAMQLTERVRAGVAESPLAPGVWITVSAGVAEILPGETFADWLGRADRALYQAKSRGRDQAVSDPSSVDLDWEDAPTEIASVRLVWDSSCESGMPLVDLQHLSLFRRSNALLEAMFNQAPPDRVRALLERLQREVAGHFRWEEKMLIEQNYPHAAEHSALHRGLEGKMSTIQNQTQTGQIPLGELVEFLTSELVAHHIRGADRIYMEWLRHRC